MGVLIEAENVVIRNATVDARLPGGMQEYEQHCPNATFCTDGQICRVGFMVMADAAAYIDQLETLGFARPTAAGSRDVAVIDQEKGFVLPCDWLELNWIDVGGAWTAVAWLKGTPLTRLVAPPNWKPGTMTPITVKDLREREFLGTEGGVEAFRDRATGNVLHVGRTQEDPGSLHLQGIAARERERWDEAASLFHRVTELRPDYLSGWLELTWALASLRRFEDAERAARRAVALDPESAAALGNLAAVLLDQKKFDEARAIAEQAVARDPSDEKNKAILAAIERAAPSKRSWWRR